VSAAVRSEREADVATPARTGGSTAAVELRNVSHWYGNVVAVNDISFTLEPGVTGLLGPNGAGKSTILHMISGFLRPSAGTLTVHGKPAWKNPAMYRDVGLVPEREAVPAYLSAYEFALLNARLHELDDPEEAARRAIASVELEDAQHRPIGTYSKGMRQRAKIAGALVHDPRVLLLDEPFNGMDPRQRLHMMQLLARQAGQGRVILFSSHILEEVHRLATTVLVIVSGRLAASGHFREIRKLMTDRPHTFTVRSSDDRRLASALVAEGTAFGVELRDGRLTVQAEDYGRFSRVLPRVAHDTGTTVFEMLPTDESLESVFSYLVQQ
jgi:ABC-2 type transport system ATP-binding protein